MRMILINLVSLKKGAYLAKVKMNYETIYNNLIYSRRYRDISKAEKGYEIHHIVPRCMGGGNEIIPYSTLKLLKRESRSSKKHGIKLISEIQPKVGYNIGDRCEG